MPPLADPLSRRRSILGDRAVIRAIDLLRANPQAQLGAGTMARLRTARPGGFDPGQLMQAVAKSGGGIDQLAGARQQALMGWNLQGQGEQGGNRAPDAMPAPPAIPAPVATGGQVQPGGVQVPRRQELLGRTGDQAISPDLRQRILARIQRERMRRGG